jgi:predicted enzyme related to lactoylglutathione lyase
MSEGVQTIIYPVRDINKAKALFTQLLGVEPIMDQPYYVGYRVGNQDIGLDPHGHDQGMTGPLNYWTVTDIKESLQALLDAGATEHQGVRDVGGGKLVASVKDADGNLIGVLQPA